MKNIMMNAEMTKAILDGRKVQIRRVIKAKITNSSYGLFNINMSDKKYIRIGVQLDEKKIIEFILKNTNPKYKKDEVIWVREPAKVLDFEITDSEKLMNLINFQYMADNLKRTIEIPFRLRKNNNYPKWIKEMQGVPCGCIKEMARIFLKITDVRVERLHNISDEDCIAEGIENRWGLCKNYIDYEMGFIEDKKYYFIGKTFSGRQMSFFTLISSIQGEKLLQSNPYVFVYEFELNKETS